MDHDHVAGILVSRKHDPKLYHQVGRIILIMYQEYQGVQEQDPELYHQVGRIILII